MRRLRFPLGFAILALLVLFGCQWLLSGTLVSPDNEKQSVFFRDYDPMPFLRPLQKTCQRAVSTASEASASAGSVLPASVHNVHFMRRVEPEICESTDYSAVLTALHGRILAALESSGCQVSLDQLTTEQGIRVSYRCGSRTSGLVAVPLPASKPGHDAGLASLRLQIDEEWAVRQFTQPN